MSLDRLYPSALDKERTSERLSVWFVTSKSRCLALTRFFFALFISFHIPWLRMPVGSITSRCSGNEPALLGRTAREDRESSGNRGNRDCQSRKDTLVKTLKSEIMHPVYDWRRLNYTFRDHSYMIRPNKGSLPRKR